MLGTVGGMVLALVLAASVAHAGTYWPRPEPCPTDPTHTVVDATVLSAERPQYRCVPHPGLAPDMLEFVRRADGGPTAPTSDTGCIVMIESPACGSRYDVNLTGSVVKSAPLGMMVTLDGIPHEVPSFYWQICGISPGDHELTHCAPGNALRCRLEVRANEVAAYEVERTEPRLRIQVERTRRGALRRGDEVAVSYDDWTLGEGYREVPTRGTFAWEEDKGGAMPRARTCYPPPSAPGCARCSGGSPGAGGLLTIGLSIAALRRRRRQP
jgi:MYXO-CTERM domain-containing protein